MKVIPKKFTIKIPSDIKIIYSYQKQIIIFIGPLKQKSLKLKTKLLILRNEKIIKVSDIPTSKKISNNEKKNLKSIQGTTVALIKQLIIETSTIIYQKLKFIGVGYRTSPVDKFKNKLVMFKLGYSHLIYFKIPKEIQISCLKLTKLFIFGNSYADVNQTASLIRSYKHPEPYKGKGILYENEKIMLKDGKKV